MDNTYEDYKREHANVCRLYDEKIAEQKRAVEQLTQINEELYLLGNARLELWEKVIKTEPKEL